MKGLKLGESEDESPRISSALGQPPAPTAAVGVLAKIDEAPATGIG